MREAYRLQPIVMLRLVEIVEIRVTDTLSGPACPIAKVMKCSAPYTLRYSGSSIIVVMKSGATDILRCSGLAIIVIMEGCTTD